MFRILNQNGYYSEKKVKTSISGTHDVSHAIYATVARWLLTADSRFYKKCEAVYTFLEVPTKVLLCTHDTIINCLDTIIKSISSTLSSDS